MHSSQIIVMKEIDLTPRGIIKRLNLRRPIYRKTAAYGHFGRNEKEFTWENLDLSENLTESSKVKLIVVIDKLTIE